MTNINENEINVLDLLQECDLCHDFYSIREIIITFEENFYCDKCLREYIYYENQEK